MQTKAIKFLFAGVVTLSAIAYLAYAGLNEGWVAYHLKVDEFTAATKFHTQRVRLCGNVADDGLAFSSGRLTADFVLLGETSNVRVQYKGVIPDLFKAGVEAVVEGKLGPDGVFHAELLMTKCASKYDAVEHTKPGARRPENHPG